MNNGDENRFDDELTGLAAKLPDGVSPGRDLWPEIAEAIAPQGKHGGMFRTAGWAQAAAIVLLVAGSSGVTYFAVKDDGHAAPEVIYSGNVFEAVSGDFGQQYTLGNEYLDARSQLAGGLEVKLSSLSPETRQAVVKNLNSIRVAIQDLNKALEVEPDNALLQELLLSTYHDEMSLMRKVDGIANSAMRRDDI